MSLGRSALLAEVFNREDGCPPPVDLEQEKRHGDFIRDNCAWIPVCTDVSDGGIALAATELAMAGGVGVRLDRADTPFLFGEDQGRYLIACNFDAAEALMLAAGQAHVALETIGAFTGDTLQFGDATAPLDQIQAIFDTSFAEKLGLSQ